MNDKIVKIELFNPYQAMYPDRNFVSRNILILIKILRSGGYDVIIKPKKEKPLEYLLQKGISDFLNDPANLLLATVGSNIATTLITNFIQKLIDGKKKSQNVFITNDVTNIVINAQSKPTTKNEIEDAKKKRRKLIKSFENCLNAKSPYMDLPWPILKNHKPVIVGWCKLQETDIGLEMADGIITDKDFKRKLDKGQYKGTSMTGIAKISTCNICSGNYVDCNHFAGEFYNGVECLNYLYEADLIEVSIVKEPVNKAGLLKLR